MRGPVRVSPISLLKAVFSERVIQAPRGILRPTGDMQVSHYQTMNQRMRKLVLYEPSFKESRGKFQCDVRRSTTSPTPANLYF